MKLVDLPAASEKAQADMHTQDAYVLSLGVKIQNGEKTIEVFSDNVWTTVKLLDFWQLQYDKYIAMSGYAGDLNGLLTNLQSALDAAILTIVLPEDRVKVIQAAAKATETVTE